MIANAPYKHILPPPPPIIKVILIKYKYFIYYFKVSLNFIKFQIFFCNFHYIFKENKCLTKQRMLP